MKTGYLGSSPITVKSRFAKAWKFWSSNFHLELSIKLCRALHKVGPAFVYTMQQKPSYVFVVLMNIYRMISQNHDRNNEKYKNTLIHLAKLVRIVPHYFLLDLFWMISTLMGYTGSGTPSQNSAGIFCIAAGLKVCSDSSLKISECMKLFLMGCSVTLENTCKRNTLKSERSKHKYWKGKSYQGFCAWISLPLNTAR